MFLKYLKANEIVDLEALIVELSDEILADERTGSPTAGGGTGRLDHRRRSLIDRQRIHHVSDEIGVVVVADRSLLELLVVVGVMRMIRHGG